MNLYEKIQAVTNDIKSIEKDLQVGNVNYGYKGVSDLAVITAVKKAETKHRVLCIPSTKQDLLNTQVVNSINSKGKEVINYVDVIKVTSRIIDLDDTSQYLDVEMIARGLDTGDKGTGKASTYARKNTLLNSYKIATGEDLDVHKSEEQTVTENQKIVAIKNNLQTERVAKLCMQLGIDSLNELDTVGRSKIDAVYNKLVKEGVIKC